MPRRAPFLSLLFTSILSLGSSAAQAAEPGAIENDLVITVQGEERTLASMKLSSCSTFPPRALR
jgi:hypothetical protein